MVEQKAFKNWPIWTVGIASAIIFTVSALHNGWMNEYYSAAAVSEAHSWHAFFFASFDSTGFLSVDKPPLGLWPSALSVFLLGASSFAVVLPHILAGIATSLVLFVLVRCVASIKLALLTAAFFLIMPVVSVMYGYNQPDSFFTLFITISLYGAVRLFENTTHRARWMALTAAALGLAFMTKTLQVLPVVAIYGVWYAGRIWLRKAWKEGVTIGALGLAVFLVISLWWPLAVALTPPHDRPYVGSTQDNSSWSLLFGYNGIDRLTQQDQVMSQSTLDGAQFGGTPGPWRLFNSEFAPLIGWLLPMVIPAFIGLIYDRKRLVRSHSILVKLSLMTVLAYGIILSVMQGVVHPYYCLAMAPALAIVASFGLQWMIRWYSKRQKIYRYILPVMIVVLGFLSALILNDDSAHVFGLAVACLAIVAGVFLVAFRSNTWPRVLIWVVSIVVIVAGPIIETGMSLSRSHRGVYPNVTVTDTFDTGVTQGAINFLQSHRSETQSWLAITESTHFAAPLELATDRPVMALGGFNGTDPILTKAVLQTTVTEGKVRYFVTAATTKVTSTSTQTQTWLLKHAAVYHDGDIAIYDLQMPL